MPSANAIGILCSTFQLGALLSLNCDYCFPTWVYETSTSPLLADPNILNSDPERKICSTRIRNQSEPYSFKKTLGQFSVKKPKGRIRIHVSDPSSAALDIWY